MKGSKLKTKDIAIMGILTAILFAQEEALTFIPNVQLTFLLITLYTKVLGFKKTLVIVTIHVCLDNLVMGSFNLITVPPMLVGYYFMVITLGLVFKKVESPLILGLLGILYAFTYDFCFAFSDSIILKTSFVAWYAMGIVFDIVLAACNFLTIYWLYKPLKKVMNMFIKNDEVIITEEIKEENTNNLQEDEKSTI